MLPLYYYNKVEIASVFHIHVCRMWKTHRSLHHHPRRGRACPARALSAAARYCFTHPVSPHTVGRGLDPSAARRGRRPPTKMARNHPTPIHARGGLRAGRPTISRSPPCRGRACPARNLPAACRQSSTHHPHNLCPPTAITPIYTLPKLHPQTLSKKSKKLAKTC